MIISLVNSIGVFSLDWFESRTFESFHIGVNKINVIGEIFGGRGSTCVCALSSYLPYYQRSNNYS